jgi:hypothetical protein
MDPEIPGKAIFVKLDVYKDILDLVGTLKDKLAGAKGTLEKLQTLKQEEEAEFELWQNSIKEIEEKINFIDRTLIEPDRE